MGASHHHITLSDHLAPRDQQCFPPYCPPGRLRKRQFGSGNSSAAINDNGREASEDIGERASESEEEYQEAISLGGPFNIPFLQAVRRHHKERGGLTSSDPPEAILQSSYLPIPHFVKQTLVDTCHDWNSLGGPRCSHDKHLSVLEREKRSRGEIETVSIRQHRREEDASSSAKPPSWGCDRRDIQQWQLGHKASLRSSS